MTAASGIANGASSHRIESFAAINVGTMFTISCRDRTRAAERAMTSEMRRELRHVLASDVPPGSAEFHLEDIVPIPRQAIAIIVGPKGAGKTTLLCWLAAQLAALGMRVLLYSIEETQPEIRARLDAAGADTTRIHLPHEEDPPLRIPRDLELLSRKINELHIDVLLLDPLEAVIANFTNAERAREAMYGLTRILRQHDACAVFGHHFVKTGNTIATAMGGAGSLRNVARAIYIFGPMPRDDLDATLLTWLGRMARATDADALAELEDDDERDEREVRVLAAEVVNGATIPPSRLFRLEAIEVPGVDRRVIRFVDDGEVTTTAEQVFAGIRVPVRDEESASAVDTAQEFLLAFLSDRPQTVSAVNAAARDAGISLRVLERARAKLKKQGVLRNYFAAGGWWLELTDFFSDVEPNHFAR